MKEAQVTTAGNDDTSPSESWGQSASSRSLKPASQRKPPPQAVPDDWDDDEEEEEEDNAKLWEEANRKVPMPELVISPSSTGQSIISPPPAAFQPAMRILKRPSPSPSASTSGAPPSSSRNTLAEREAQYQEARERIFGASKRPVGHGSDVRLKGEDGKGEPLVAVSVVRNPIGPTDNDSSIGPEKNRPAKGFGSRRKDRPTASPPTSQSR
ncbi:hypothetical protein BV22DRAFT_1112337 [Leucogyrophana mollusca]|uniref:Uncharacterized protein n=1 Tax=Leucogyrophana mollusca TaxID=85980 RepID=A0ACB8BKI0_9AGAM|nr:hypothetical protein BV22DRAFT_1112337 [Leucogyrophana mollusca]